MTTTIWFKYLPSVADTVVGVGEKSGSAGVPKGAGVLVGAGAGVPGDGDALTVTSLISEELWRPPSLVTTTWTSYVPAVVTGIVIGSPKELAGWLCHTVLDVSRYLAVTVEKPLQRCNEGFCKSWIIYNIYCIKRTIHLPVRIMYSNEWAKCGLNAMF